MIGSGGLAMKTIAGLAALSVLIAGSALAQDVGGPPPPPPPLPAPATTVVLPEWRAVPAENLLVIDTTRGRILVELMPEVAPLHVERIKLLARRGFYDNVSWHRVIDWFMAQTGDPLGNGEGQSPYPDLKGEFTFRRDSAMPFAAVAEPAVETTGDDDAGDETTGHMGAEAHDTDGADTEADEADETDEIAEDFGDETEGDAAEDPDRSRP